MEAISTAVSTAAQPAAARDPLPRLLFLLLPHARVRRDYRVGFAGTATGACFARRGRRGFMHWARA